MALEAIIKALVNVAARCFAGNATAIQANLRPLTSGR